MELASIVFCLLSILAVGSALMVVLGKNPVGCAISLVGHLFFLAAIYAFLGADFTAAIQIIVYAGAIVVLFVFVIMLLNVGPNVQGGLKAHPGELGVLLAAIVTFLIVAFNLVQDTPAVPAQVNSEAGNTVLMARALFSNYLWPFELASLLILLATVASIIIAKKSKHSEDPGR